MNTHSRSTASDTTAARFGTSSARRLAVGAVAALALPASLLVGSSAAGAAPCGPGDLTAPTTTQKPIDHPDLDLTAGVRPTHSVRQGTKTTPPKECGPGSGGGGGFDGPGDLTNPEPGDGETPPTPEPQPEVEVEVEGGDVARPATPVNADATFTG